MGNGLKPEKDNAVVVIAVPTAIAVIMGQVNVTINGFANGISSSSLLWIVLLMLVP
jgi:hypothetical protein